MIPEPKTILAVELFYSYPEHFAFQIMGYTDTLYSEVLRLRGQGSTIDIVKLNDKFLMLCPYVQLPTLITIVPMAGFALKVVNVSEE